MAKRKVSWFASCMGDQLRDKKCVTKERCRQAFKDAVEVCKLKKSRR